MCFVCHEVEQDAKTASKNIISSGSYDFLNLAPNTITIHAQTSNRGISNDFRIFFEKTMHGRGPNLGSYVPLMSFNKLISVIFEIVYSNCIVSQTLKKS